MALSDLISDHDAWWHNVSRFGVSCTYAPAEATTTATIVVVPGDVSEVIEYDEARSRETTAREMQASMVRSDLQTAIDGTTGASSRDPIRGDVITFPASHAHAGDWYVQHMTQDIGDSVQVLLRSTSDYNLRGTLGD